MAIFGGIGKRLGLGSAESIVTRVTGSPLAGAIAGEVSEGVSGLGRSLTSNIGQGTAVSQSGTPPAETARSGERGPASNGAAMQPARSGLVQNISYVPPAPSSMRATPTGLPAVITGGGALATQAGRMLMFGGGTIAIAPLILDPLTGEEKKLRVTRKLRSQVKKAVEMFGVEMVADQMGTDVEVIFYILTKKMRNDGPYVTKAAVRKTRQTVRKMKHLCDMYDDLRPTAKRRAPVRRMAATKITNVK